jgi:8-oxo-dGTP pyrophosphatase MutT (NUDIX family)
VPGGIDPDETPLQAAVRELFEETNISSVEVLAEIPRWLPYEFPTEVKCKLSGSWAKYKGQAQRWFLMKFKGDKSGQQQRFCSIIMGCVGTDADTADLHYHLVS